MCIRGEVSVPIDLGLRLSAEHKLKAVSWQARAAIIHYFRAMNYRKSYILNL
jgi:hypothetical protein